MKSWWITGICILACAGLRAEDPLEAVRSYAGVSDISEDGLKKGEIYSRASGIDGFPRGVFTELVWWMKAPPEAVAKVITDGPEPAPGETKIYRVIRGTPTLESFAALKLNASRSADKKLIEETSTGDGLFISPREQADAAEMTGKKASAETAAEAWRKILLGRCLAFQKAGLRGMPATSHGNDVIRASEEVRGMISAFPKAVKRFSRTLSDTLYAAGAKCSLWWDLSVVNEIENPSCGATFVVPSSDSLRVFDITFFSGGTYFFSVSLYEAWAWNGGALVYRLDLLSIPVRAYSLGVDRSIASKMMGNEVRAQVQRWQKTLK